MKFIAKIFYCIVILFLNASTSIAQSNNSQPTRPYGFYGGFVIPSYSTYGGDKFNGNWAMINKERIIRLPKIENGIGWGLYLGYVFDISSGKDNRFATETRYTETDHEFDSSFYSYQNKFYVRGGGDANFHKIDFNIKGYAYSGEYFGIYTMLVVGYSWLVLNKSSLELRTSNDTLFLTSIGNPSLFGLTYGGGVGVSYYFHPRISIDLESVFRITHYTYIEVKGWQNYQGEYSNSSFNLNLGISVLLFEK
jgi:hypothetical protein